MTAVRQQACAARPANCCHRRRSGSGSGVPVQRRALVDFAVIAVAALPHLPALLARWLPDGRRQGREWVARNPTRTDRRAGSFKVNIRTGRWADFATGERGGDVVSLAAYLHHLTQHEAALKLAEMLGFDSGGAR